MRIERWLVASLIALMYLLGVTVATAAPACATITPAPAYSSVNIRSSPAMADGSAGSPTNIIGQLLRGQVANVTALSSTGWYTLASTGFATAGGYIASSVVVCVTDPTPTRIPSSTPPIITPAATPVMFTVCVQDVCSLFSSPLRVTIEEYRP